MRGRLTRILGVGRPGTTRSAEDSRPRPPSPVDPRESVAPPAPEPARTVRALDYPGQPILLHIDSELDRMRAGSCAKEPETVAWIERTVRAGDVLYDVGANIGAYSLIAARVGGGGAEILAFEPSFSTYHQLCRNILLNALQETVSPHLIAISDRTSLARFNYCSLEAGASLHTLGETIDYKGDPFDPVLRQNVLGVKLDDLVDLFGFPPPTLLKVDVDGTELEVLRGGGKTLLRPTLREVLVEVCPTRGTADEIDRFLVGSGFRREAEFRHSPLVMNRIYSR